MITYDQVKEDIVKQIRTGGESPILVGLTYALGDSKLAWKEVLDECAHLSGEDYLKSLVERVDNSKTNLHLLTKIVFTSLVIMSLDIQKVLPVGEKRDMQ